jgi:AP-1 complex subunit beta-1
LLPIITYISSFGVAPAQPSIQGVSPGQSVDTSLALTVNPSMMSSTPVNGAIQVALKNNVGVFYFQITLPLHVLFSEQGQINREEYPNYWGSIQDQFVKDLPFSVDANNLQRKLQGNNVFYIAKRSVGAQVN